MIAVYALRIDRNLSPKEFYRLMNMISSDKRERMERFRCFEDAQRTLLGDVLIRVALKDRFGLPNGAIVFETNAFGKPYLASNPEYHFNISHAKNYVVGAVGCSPVGIDVEAIKWADMGLADRFFTLQEKQYILDHPSSRRPIAFFQIWTRKEAYIKRKGRGLHIPLNSFDVLSPIENTWFHLIFENDEALCHICSCESMSPTISHHTVDGFLKHSVFNSCVSAL